MLNQQLIEVSPKALGLARDLGMKMVQEDRIIRPRLFQLGGDREYSRFRNAHRAYWEQSDQFDQVWQPRIFTLGEREAYRLAMSDYNSIANWDLWYNRIINPLKAALWDTWERAYRLEYLYEEAISKPFAGANLQASQILSGNVDGRPGNVLPRPYAASARPRGLLMGLMSILRGDRPSAA